MGMSSLHFKRAVIGCFVAFSSSIVCAAGSVGLSTAFMPKYEGTKKYKAEFFPSFSYEDKHFFIGPKAGMPAAGLKSDLTDQWQMGVFGAYESGRKASDDHHLQGTGSIHKHMAAGLFTRWHAENLAIDLSVYHALKKNYGTNVQLGASYQLWRSSDASIRLGGVAHWSDSDAMGTYFTVSQQESVRSGGRLSAYHASSGLRSVSIYGSHSLQLSPKWRLHSLVGVKQLTGDAADSPIVQHKASVFGSVGLGYHF